MRFIPETTNNIFKGKLKHMQLFLFKALYLKHTLLISAIQIIIKSKHFIYVTADLLQINKRRIQTRLF